MYSFPFFTKKEATRGSWHRYERSDRTLRSGLLDVLRTEQEAIRNQNWGPLTSIAFTHLARGALRHRPAAPSPKLRHRIGAASGSVRRRRARPAHCSCGQHHPSEAAGVLRVAWANSIQFRSGLFVLWLTKYVSGNFLYSSLLHSLCCIVLIYTFTTHLILILLIIGYYRCPMDRSLQN